MSAELDTGIGAAGAAAAAVGAGTAGGSATLARASLQKVEPTTSEPIQFQFNPASITVKHSVQTKGVKGQSRAEQIMDLGNVEIGISKIIFYGPQTKSTCDTLLSWSTTYASTVTTPTGPQQLTQAVGLQLTWGAEGLSYQVNLRTVTISYVRFTRSGTPIRAEVGLELHTGLEKYLPPTNPSSGGPPGRRIHLVDGSQRLASLAAASYGRAGAWRGIARANGIDDPLRVRPGTLLYLPEPDGLGHGDLREPAP